ncbi:MAG TPA: hypothetical protein VFV10_07345, partial [Gammaproteobacteria bacterium]|nr:hypothetical protein [Gammaproteobacteria bacterium]
MMILFLALVGGVIGIAYFDGHFGGFLAGGAVGALAGWVAELNARLKKIEMHLRDAPSRAPAEPSRAPSQTSPAPQAQTSATARTQTSA